MKIKNPTDQDLKLNYKGVIYELPAGVTDSFPEDVTAQWLYIYGFLNIVSATNKEVDTVLEQIQEEVKKKEEKVSKAKAK